MRNYLILFAVMLSCARAATAGELIRYEIVGYGSRHVLVLLSGSIPVGLTTSMSADGMSARVSGVDVQFAAKDESKAIPGLVSSVQQVRRGLATDLVLNLAEASDLTASSGTASLKLFIKTRKGSGINNESKQHETSTTSQTRPRSSPIKLLTSNQKIASQPAGLTIVLPEMQGLKPLSGLSAELRNLAYALDIVWSVLSARKMEYDQAAAAASTTAESNQASDLDALVNDLTKELVELRNQLAEKNSELEQLRGQSGQPDHGK